MNRFKRLLKNGHVRGFLICALCIALVTGCASYPKNERLNAYQKDYGYRFDNLTRGENTDSLFVVLCFSGGGTRAATMSYWVLDRLAKTTITWKGEQKRLIDEVDVISSVSGGSFTAGYYGLFGDQIFIDFYDKFLKENIQKKLKLEVLKPINWFRLASPNYSRIDLASAYYNDHIFNHKTFGDLLERGKRPFLMINATHMSTGRRFEFTQPRFNDICSDLNPVSVARAVAASSAFPGLLTALTIENYGFDCGMIPPRWTRGALRDRDITSNQFYAALEYETYKDTIAHHWLHLLDGGVSDNLGILGPMDMMLSLSHGNSLLGKLNMGVIEKMVFIVVNAGTDKPKTWGAKERHPSIFDVVLAAATTPMDRLSNTTMKALSERVVALEQFYDKQHGCENQNPDCRKIDFYPVFLGFQGIKDEDNDDNIREKLLGLPTSFYLTEPQLNILKKGTAILLDSNVKLKKLIRDLE